MKRILLGLLICGFAGACVGCIPPSSIRKTGAILAPGAVPRYEPVVADIESMIRKTMSRSRIPGLSVVLCDSRGPIWEAGFGYGDDARTVAVDGNTLFSIQSMSKTFTAVGVLTAVRDGLVELDAPISGYLPDFRIQSIFEDRPQDRITLRHLLMHTVGFTHEAPGGGNNDGSEIDFDHHVENIQDTWLMCRVGDRYQYSNLDIDLAGYIVERVSGTPFIDYMGRNVFAALDLERTTMDPSRIKAETNRATGHQRGFTRLPVIAPMTGAGGVYASAHDLGTFLTFMLKQGLPEGEVLTSALFREMYTTPNHGGYGLGVAMGRRGANLYYHHGGGGYGFLAFMAWYPTLDIARRRPYQLSGSRQRAGQARRSDRRYARGRGPRFDALSAHEPARDRFLDRPDRGRLVVLRPVPRAHRVEAGVGAVPREVPALALCRAALVREAPPRDRVPPKSVREGAPAGEWHDHRRRPASGARARPLLLEDGRGPGFPLRSSHVEKRRAEEALSPEPDRRPAAGRSPIPRAPLPAWPRRP